MAVAEAVAGASPVPVAEDRLADLAVQHRPDLPPLRVPEVALQAATAMLLHNGIPSAALAWDLPAIIQAATALHVLPHVRLFPVPVVQRTTPLTAMAEWVMDS